MYEKPITDRLIRAELYLPQGEDMKAAKVVGRTKDEDGNIIGTYDHDPMLNSMVYDIEFPDGEIKEYSANIIAQNMYAQVDANGHHHTLLDSIVDYQKLDNAVDKADQYLTTKTGRKQMRHTTEGWNLLVSWKDESQQLVPLKIIKESNPVEVAEFASARGIGVQPAFQWWVPYMLRKRDQIIAAVNLHVA
jgi:hypothetical protein